MFTDPNLVKAAPVGHVYRMSWQFRGFSVAFLGIGLVGLGSELWHVQTTDATLTWTAILASVAFPLVVAGLTAHAFVSKVIFTSDSLVRVTLFKQQRVPLSSIRGRREYVVTGGDTPGSTRYLRLERNDGFPPLDLGKRLYRFDEAFRAWYERLPDLDAMDRVKHKDSNFGLV